MTSFGHNLQGSRDGGKFINYQLAPGEVLLTCPYESSHRVEKSRFGRHLAKCRENYKKAKKSNVDMRVCRWNAFHHYPAPEILYHEQNCMDQSEIVEHVAMLNKPEAPNIKNVVNNSAPVVKSQSRDVKHDPNDLGGECWEEEANNNREQNARGYNPQHKLKNSKGIIRTLPGITTKSEREAFRKEQYQEFLKNGENFQDASVEDDQESDRRRNGIGFSIASTSASEQQRYDEAEDGSVSSYAPSSPDARRKRGEGYLHPGSSSRQ